MLFDELCHVVMVCCVQLSTLCPAVHSIILFVWCVISSHLYVGWNQTFLAWSVDGLIQVLVLYIMLCDRLILHVAVINYILVLCYAWWMMAVSSPLCPVILFGCIQFTLSYYIGWLYAFLYVLLYWLTVSSPLCPVILVGHIQSTHAY